MDCLLFVVDGSRRSTRVLLRTQWCDPSPPAGARAHGRACHGRAGVTRRPLAAAGTDGVGPARLRGFLHLWAEPRDFQRDVVVIDRGRQAGSQLRETRCDLPIAFREACYPSDRVDNGRMIPSSESLSDPRGRIRRELSGQCHGDLSRTDDSSRSTVGDQIRAWQLVEIRDDLEDSRELSESFRSNVIVRSLADITA